MALPLDEARSYILAHYLQWLASVLIFLLGILFIRAVSWNLLRFFRGRDYDPTIEIFIERTLGWFLWAVLLIVFFANLGLNVTGFLAGLGAIGFIIGFATKDIFSNVAAGLLMILVRPFRVGETVDISGIRGAVREINISYCVIITEADEYVIIPNSRIWGNPIKNITKGQKVNAEKKPQEARDDTGKGS